jgi:hypothetical protein
VTAAPIRTIITGRQIARVQRRDGEVRYLSDRCTLNGYLGFTPKVGTGLHPVKELWHVSGCSKYQFQLYFHTDTLLLSCRLSSLLNLCFIGFVISPLPATRCDPNNLHGRPNSITSILLELDAASIHRYVYQICCSRLPLPRLNPDLTPLWTLYEVD